MVTLYLEGRGNKVRTRNIGAGIFLILVGILWALNNAGIADFHLFESIFYLWPLMLVVIGINIIFKDNSLIRTLTWLIFIVVIISYGYFYGNKLVDPRIFRGGCF